MLCRVLEDVSQSFFGVVAVRPRERVGSKEANINIILEAFYKEKEKKSPVVTKQKCGLSFVTQIVLEYWYSIPAPKGKRPVCVSQSEVRHRLRISKSQHSQFLE